MGEYWKLVNVTKAQHLHPHRLDNGLKFGEWADYDSNVIERARALVQHGVWSASDELRAVSDYGGNRVLRDLATLDYGPNEDPSGTGEGVLYRACGEDVSVAPKLPGQEKLRDWGAPKASPPNGAPQDVADLMAVARRVVSDCADADDLAAARRILERLGQ